VSEYVSPKYTLDVVCDHSRNGTWAPTPTRVVARICHLPKPPNTIGFLEWREVIREEDPDYPPAAQTYFGEARRLGIASRSGLGEMRRLLRMTEGQRWRFWCADCDDTLPARHTRLEPVLDALRQNRVSSVTLSALAPILTS
jgi:hypothetical protein